MIHIGTSRSNSGLAGGFVFILFCLYNLPNFISLSLVSHTGNSGSKWHQQNNYLLYPTTHSAHCRITPPFIPPTANSVIPESSFTLFSSVRFVFRYSCVLKLFGTVLACEVMLSVSHTLKFMCCSSLLVSKYYFLNLKSNLRFVFIMI